MRNRCLTIGLCLALLAGCAPIDSLREGFTHSQAVSARLEKSVGLKSFVGFNWNIGSLTTVNVIGFMVEP